MAFIIAQFLIILQEFFENSYAIRCFCTEENCVPYGECESNVCLVGITDGKGFNFLYNLFFSYEILWQ